MTTVLTHPIPGGSDPVLSAEVASRRENLRKARRVGLALSAAIAMCVSVRPGIGLAFTVACSLIAVARLVGFKTLAGWWCMSWAAAAPILFIRDNSWLALCVLATAVAVAGVSLCAHVSGQSVANFEPGRLLRTAPAIDDWSPGVGEFNGRLVPVARGVLIAVPVIVIFAALLASADSVFAEVLSFVAVDPSWISMSRIAVFIFCLLVLVPVLVAAADVRASTGADAKSRLGTIEVSIVLGSVNALFLVFVGLRAMRVGEQLPDELLRGDVRAGFFQLLFVAALTVILVLAVRRYAREAIRSRGVRSLAFAVIALAAVIDGFAIVRIEQYVAQSFTTPLRFWSFAFGLWLLLVLAITAARLTSAFGERRWFVFALGSSWMLFVVAMAVANPDVRIAEHNFANPPVGEDQYISVKPLIWLSEDATGVIVDNIEVLRPMPGARYQRMVDHLCAYEDSESLRDFHLAHISADIQRFDLCRPSS